MYIGHMLWTQRAAGYCLWSGRRLDRELLGRLFRFGFPSGMQQFLDVACWSVFVQLMGGLGTAELAATSLIFNLNSIVFVPTIGLSTAVTALVGQRIGDARPELAVRTTWLAFAVATVYTVLFSTVYVFAPHLILKPYGIGQSQAALEQLVIYLLRFVAAYSVFDAMGLIFSAAIRGAGDTRFAMLLNVVVGALFLVLPTFIATRFGSDGFTAAWYAVILFLVVLGLSFMARFQQGAWKKMRVIEHVAGEPAPVPEPAAV
jgi:MATE family multidrug resistance protein